MEMVPLCIVTHSLRCLSCRGNDRHRAWQWYSVKWAWHPFLGNCSGAQCLPRDSTEGGEEVGDPLTREAERKTGGNPGCLWRCHSWVLCFSLLPMSTFDVLSALTHPVTGQLPSVHLSHQDLRRLFSLSIISLCNPDWLASNLPYRLGWARTHRDLPSSAFPGLGLKVCTTGLIFSGFFHPGKLRFFCWGDL